MNRHALVTGGAGFVGSHLVDRLLESGWLVTVVDSFDDAYDPSVKRRNLSDHIGRESFRLVACDIRDGAGLDRLLVDRYDTVVHLAARPGVRASILSPALFQDVNVNGTQTVLDFAVRRGIDRFVFASSSSVYGINPDVPWTESDRNLLPISPYGSTKLSGELLGHVYSHLYGIRFFALRLFTVYGPRQRPDLAIHKFAKRMVEGRSIPFFGDGETLRDYTHVDDIVAGLVAAIDYAATSYEVVNIGSGCPVSLRRLISELENALGVEANLDNLPEQPGDVPQTWADVSRARDLLGYAPSVSISDGIADFAAWLRREEVELA